MSSQSVLHRHILPLQGAKQRLPNIDPDQALQFTPFTTSVLFATDRIPFPEVLIGSQDGAVATADERAQAERASNDDKRQVLNSIAHFLNGETCTEYLFPSGLVPPPNPNDRQPVPPLDLPDLAAQLYRAVDPPFQHASPRGSKIPVSMSRKRKRALVAPPTPVESSSSHIKLTQTYRQDKNLAPPSGKNGIVPNGLLTPISINVPILPKSENSEEYLPIGEQDLQKERSREAKEAQTKRASSDHAVVELQDYMQEVFQAQDVFDTIDDPSELYQVEAYFELHNGLQKNGMTLTLAALERFKDGLKKLVTLQRGTDVSEDDLRRLQELSEPAIEAFETANFRVNHVSRDEEVDELRNNLHKAHTGSLSATILGYTILCKPDEDSLIASDAIGRAVNGLSSLVDSCIIPAVESRIDDQDASTFKTASLLKPEIKDVLNSCQKLLDLLATICVELKSGIDHIRTVEFLAAKLIFVQNAVSEKNAALGLQIFEKFRKTAMSALSRIYARFPRERDAILDEVLTSLDKLPSTARSARQFKLADGRSIQLVSALFMQMVQTTTIGISGSSSVKKARTSTRTNLDDSDNDESTHYEVQTQSEAAAAETDEPRTELKVKICQRFDDAINSARRMITYLVDKASRTTKTGDSPFRSILELLIEDLIAVLPDHEWPAAEMLLRIMASHMLHLINTEKTASTKNMALEAVGVMASATANLQTTLRTSADFYKRNLAIEKNKDRLSTLIDLHFEFGHLKPEDLLLPAGPFALVAQSLAELRSSTSSLYTHGAYCFFLAQYTRLVSIVIESGTEIDADTSSDLAVIDSQVLDMLDQPRSEAISTMKVTSENAKIAYLLCVLNLSFCRKLYDMVKALSTSLSSDMTQVRARSLKSMAVVLDVDASLLDRDADMIDDIFKCASDDSAMVKDSALALISKFVMSKPAFETKCIRLLLDCTQDSKIGVQKRAIGQLKDIYLNEKRAKVREAILCRLLEREEDHEEQIIELVQQTLEEILVKPVSKLLEADAQAATTIVAIQELAQILMSSLSSNPDRYTPLLLKFLQSLLKSSSKNVAMNSRLCSVLVSTLFECIGQAQTQPPLLVMTALAQVDARLIPPQQLVTLKSYLEDIKTEADLFMFRSTIEIFIHVLPHLSEAHKILLAEVQGLLMKAISKLGRRVELDSVMKCLMIIDTVLNNTEKLVRLTASVVNQLGKPSTQQIRLIHIAGAIGKHIDIDKYKNVLSANGQAIYISLVPNSQGMTASAHLASSFLPLLDVKNPLEVRLAGLESLGSVCQASPAQLHRADVKKVMLDILDFRTPVDIQLRSIVLVMFEELYQTRKAVRDKDKTTNASTTTLKQIGGDAKSRDQDAAVSSVTLDIVEKVAQIALSEVSNNALLATTTLASISEQGLIHPKHCLGVFVALGSNDDSAIANIARKAQSLLHEQHESHCEREYVSAVQQAFEYRERVYHDGGGAYLPGPVARLGRCFSVINSSNTKYVKKFLSNIISKLTIDEKLKSAEIGLQKHLGFTRFVAHNLAHFEYKTVSELLHVALQLELAYSKTGAELAQTIEAKTQQYPDISQAWTYATVSMDLQGSSGDNQTALPKEIDPQLILEMKRLAPIAACSYLLIECRAHLKKQYGLEQDIRSAMLNNKQAKETTKAPAKTPFFVADRFLHKSNQIFEQVVSDPVRVCKDFVSAISVDDVSDVSDNDTEQKTGTYFDTPGANAVNTEKRRGRPKGSVNGSGASVAKKRKSSVGTPNGTPTKKSRGRPRNSDSVRRMSSDSSIDGDLDGDDDYDG